MDDVVKNLKIESVDFIHIDVSGFEADVIQGASETLSRNRPIVALALNHWCLNAFQRLTIPDFFDFLRATFPILYAAHGKTYLNLHDQVDNQAVMHRHIATMGYANIVGAFQSDQVASFEAAYAHRLSD